MSKSLKASKEFRKELSKNGFKLNRCTGDHFIYEGVVDGKRTCVPVPLKLNYMMERRLRKTYLK